MHNIGLDANVLQYADDFWIYIENKNVSQCVGDLKYVMHCCKNYFHQQGFEISPKKSAVVFFTGHRFPTISNLCLAGFNIPLNKQYTYLGITVDTKLTWDEHLSKCLIKSEKSLNILKAVNRYSWGSDPKINLMFYRAYTRSILDYGRIFCMASATKSRLIKLDRLQYKALLIVLGAMKSTPTAALLAECGEQSLHLRCQFLAQKFLLKYNNFDQNNLLPKLAHLTIQDLTNPYWQNKSYPILADAFVKMTEYGDISKAANLPFL